MRHITRSLAMVAMMLAMIAGVLAAGISAGTALANPISAAPRTVPHHDMSHPMKANYPCPGMPRSGLRQWGRCRHSTALEAAG